MNKIILVLAVLCVVSLPHVSAQSTDARVEDLFQRVSGDGDLFTPRFGRIPRAPASRRARPVRPSLTPGQRAELWSEIAAGAERKEDGTLTVEETSMFGMVRHVFRVVKSATGERSIALEKSSLLAGSGSYIGTNTTFETDDKGETLASARLFILGQSANDPSSHDPIFESLDVNNGLVRKDFNEEKLYWFKHWRKAR